jgi:hypothetical protein
MTFKNSVDRAVLAIEQLAIADGTFSLDIAERKLVAETVLHAAADAYRHSGADKFGYHGWHENLHGRFASTQNGVYACYAKGGKATAYVSSGGETREISFDGSTIKDAILAAEQHDAYMQAIGDAWFTKPPALSYRPNGDTDDWGMIRRSNGKLFAVVRRPLPEAEASEARRAKTDPFETLSRLLMAASEGILSQPDDARRTLVELCASIAAGEKTRSDAVADDIDATEWDKVAARHHAEAAERIRRGIMGILETFNSTDDED